MRQMKPILIGLAFVCLVLGFIGIFIPLFPTTPFILLASFLFFHSSPKFHNWLENHRIFGPYLQEWHQGRGFSEKRKRNILIVQGIITLITILFVPIPLAKIVVVISFVSFFIFLRFLPSVNLDEPVNKKSQTKNSTKKNK